MTQRDYRTKVNSPTGAIADSDVFTFDKSSRMLTAASGRYTNTVTQTYDIAGRLTTEALTIAGQTYTTQRAYDSRSQLSQLTYPDGSVVQRSYNNEGQLHQITYGGTVRDTRTYDNGGRLATSTYGNGVSQTFAYRPDNTTASITFAHPGSVATNLRLGSYTYTWDANKNKTGETITGQLANYGFSTGTSGYDFEDRATTWNRTDGAKNQSWTLSLVGDWNSFTDADTTQTRTHGPTHEFTSLTVGGNTSPVTYDVKGNQLTRPAALLAPALNMVWDFDNKMKGADTNGTPATLEVTYEYDALGRRVARNEGSSQTVYIQAGEQTICDYPRGTPASTSPTYRYVYGSYIDQPILRQEAGASGAIYYYHYNQQFSVVGLTNSTGASIERYAYSAHGELVVLNATGTSVLASSAYSQRYTYTGREWDNTLKMYFFRARWFDSNAGRFIGRDPLGYVDGMSMYLNNFSTAGNDPLGSFVIVGDEWLKKKADNAHESADGYAACKYDEFWKWVQARKCAGKFSRLDIAKGCYMITSCLIGKDIYHDTKTGAFTTCFLSIEQALRTQSRWEDTGVCKGRNSVGGNSRPVIFGMTFNLTKVRDASAVGREDRGITTPFKNFETCPCKCQDCNGEIIWNDDVPGREWPFDFGFYDNDEEVMIHASCAETGDNDGNGTTDGLVYISTIRHFEMYSENNPNQLTIYCVVCEGDGRRNETRK
jgi:RHS repeat-associated protein